MKIGIDGTPLTIPFVCGVRNYAEELINNLALIDKKNIYIVYASTIVKLPSQKNFRHVILPNFPIFKRQLFLPIAIRKDHIDVFHNLEPFGSILLTHPKIITTIHDFDLRMTYPIFSRYFLNRIYCELIRIPILIKTKKIIANSDFTKMETVKKLKFIRISSKIISIPMSQDKDFKPALKLKIKENYLLGMGDFAIRKNIKGLIKAYSDLPQKFRLKYLLKIIVSTHDSALKFRTVINKFRMSKYIYILESINKEKLIKLYSNATVFIYPSLYEGFGIPILEAMACGCPVITSNFGVMKETSGGSALLVNSRSTKDLTAAIKKIISSPKLRRKLKNIGLKRSKMFSWNETAKKTLSCYREI